jgi:hypothetical protein
VVGGASTSVPLWAAILIALGGGVLAVLVRIAYERGAEFRTRQIEAADEYLAVAWRVMTACRQLWLPLYTRRALSGDDADLRFEELRVARDDKMLALSRMTLLFGESSPAGPTLIALDDALDGATGSLEVLYGRATIESPLPGLKPAQGLYTSAVQKIPPALAAFTDAVHKEMRRTWLLRKIAEFRQRFAKRKDEPVRWQIRPVRLDEVDDQDGGDGTAATSS